MCHRRAALTVALVLSADHILPARASPLLPSSPPTVGMPPPAVAMPSTPPEAAPPSVDVAIAVGVATALVPLVVGTSLLAAQSFDSARLPVHLIDAGLALAPIAAHAWLGEWQRGAAFGALSVTTSLGVSTLIEARPQLF